MKIFSSSPACAKAQIMRSNVCPIWAMAPFGASLVEFSFTNFIFLHFASQREYAKSKIALHPLDLWDIITMGDSFNRFGGLFLMFFHATRWDFPLFTFSLTSSWNFCIGHGSISDTWDLIPTPLWCPLLTTAYPSLLDILTLHTPEISLPLDDLVQSCRGTWYHSMMLVAAVLWPGFGIAPDNSSNMELVVVIYVLLLFPSCYPAGGFVLILQWRVIPTLILVLQAPADFPHTFLCDRWTPIVAAPGYCNYWAEIRSHTEITHTFLCGCCMPIVEAPGSRNYCAEIRYHTEILHTFMCDHWIPIIAAPGSSNYCAEIWYHIEILHTFLCGCWMPILRIHDLVILALISPFDWSSTPLLYTILFWYRTLCCGGNSLSLSHCCFDFLWRDTSVLISCLTQS